MKKAKIHMADGGDIIIELFDKEAPGTVQNFVDLINKGFYSSFPPCNPWFRSTMWLP